MTISLEHLITLLLFFLNLVMSLFLLWFRAELKALHVELKYLKEIVSRLERRLYSQNG